MITEVSRGSSDAENPCLVSDDCQYRALCPLGADNHLYGYGGNECPSGGDDDDLLDGGEGADVLKGFGGINILDGGDGAQHDDGRYRLGRTYAVAQRGEVVTELLLKESTRKLRSTTYTLGDQVENLDLFNIGGLNGTGNDLETVIGDRVTTTC